MFLLTSFVSIASFTGLYIAVARIIKAGNHAKYLFIKPPVIFIFITQSSNDLLCDFNPLLAVFHPIIALLNLM